MTRSGFSSFLLDPRVIEQAREVARSDQVVLLQGERGTGKHGLAKFIHQSSKRKNRPFGLVAIEGVPEELLKGQIFGTFRSSFTGWAGGVPSIFEACRGGTVLFHRVESLSLMLQVYLLRSLLTGNYHQFGQSQEQPCDVRFLFSTAADLAIECQQNRSRLDFCSLIAKYTIQLAPLRERRGEISQLASQLRRGLLKRELRGVFAGKRAPKLSPEALDAATQASWPGNLRALDEAVLRAMGEAESGQTIGPEALCPRADEGQIRGRLQRVLDVVLRQHQGLDEATAFIEQAENKLRLAGKWQSRAHGDARILPSPVAPPKARLAPAAACLLRRDALESSPRWPHVHAAGLFSRWFSGPLVAPGARPGSRP